MGSLMAMRLQERKSAAWWALGLVFWKAWN
jgi:hypothetical protein